MSSGAVDLARRTVRRLRYLRFLIAARGRVRVGDAFVIGPRPTVARGTSFEAGSRVNIASEFVSHVHARIGDDVMISSRVALIGKDHSFDDPALTIQDQHRLPVATVVLEGDNLIGFGTIIVGDVTIGRGAIVGAGSVVTRDLPPDTVCVGAPAVPIRKRR